MYGLHGLSRSCDTTSMVLEPLISDFLDAKPGSLPIHYVWDRVDESVQGHCFHVDGFFIGSGSANVTLNFIIFLLVGRCSTFPSQHEVLNGQQPIPLLLRLRTTLRQQIILFAIFTLAGLYVDEADVQLDAS